MAVARIIAKVIDVALCFWFNFICSGLDFMGTINFWMVRLGKSSVFKRISSVVSEEILIFFLWQVCDPLFFFFYIALIYFECVLALRYTKFCNGVALKKTLLGSGDIGLDCLLILVLMKVIASCCPNL